MTLPVIPQAPGVGLQLGQLDLRAAQGAIGFPGIEAGRIVDEAHDLNRYAEITQEHVDHASHRRQVRQGASRRMLIFGA